MGKTRIMLSASHQSGYENDFISKALRNNELSLRGNYIDEFENNLESFLGKDKKVLVVNSGTSAIHLGLLLLGVKPGDEVICPTMTFVAAVNPILYIGALPVFVDSEEITWNLCPIALEKAILNRISKGKKPKAIIAVHSYGVPYQVDLICEIAHFYKIPILEDSAEALGSCYRGGKCGTFGDLSAISFNGNKIITAAGGGALVLNSLELKVKALSLATQSKENFPYYLHKSIGFNYRMSNINAAVGCAQLKKIEDRVNSRRSVNSFYRNLFSKIDGVLVFEVPDDNYYSNYWLTTILVDSTKGFDNQGLYQALDKENIESRFLWNPLHLQPFLKNNLFFGRNVAENLFGSGLCLPSGSSLSDDDKDRVKKVVYKYFKIS